MDKKKFLLRLQPFNHDCKTLIKETNSKATPKILNKGFSVQLLVYCFVGITIAFSCVIKHNS